jgi:hypothetical protein
MSLRVIEGSAPSQKLSPKEKAAWDKLVAAYEAASEDDRNEAASLANRAKTGKRESIIYNLRPGVAAALFFDFNKQNREWGYISSEAYAKQISSDDWHFTNQGIGFLVSGNLGDGQHRCAGVALAGKAVDVNVVFGMEEKALIAIDSQKRRQASDFMDITRQETDSKRKQQVIKRGFHYLAASSKDEEAARPYLLTNNQEIAREMEKHRALIEEALIIADESVHGRSQPTLSAADAAGIVFVLLLTGWHKAKVISDLDILQTGQDREGANSPLFVASTTITKADKRDRNASLTARYGAVVRGFQLHEEGIKAVKPAEIRNAMKSANLPAPLYPAAMHAAE